MLYIDKYGAHTLNIPRNVVELPEGDYRMVIRSTMELVEYTLPIDSVTETLLMLLVELNFPEIASGSYEYTINKGNVEIGSGLLEVGGGEDRVREYNSNITFEQYEE